MYSIMIYLSQLQGNYQSVMKMPIRDFHLIMNHKAIFEEKKNKIMENETRQQAMAMESRRGSGTSSPVKIGGI